MSGATVEQVKALNAPTPPERVQWRGDRTTRDKSRINVLGYIDARDVIADLDEKVGPENWQDRYEDIAGGYRCGVGIHIDGEWVWKWDAHPQTDIEAIKGGHSKALVRAAVKWGIGRDLYDLPDLWVAAKETYSGSGKYEPSVLPTWNGSGWVTTGAPSVQSAPAASQRPVAVPNPSADTNAPEFAPNPWDASEVKPFAGNVPEFAPFAGVQPNVGDECPLHPGEKWRGSVGDLYHGPKGITPDGYCRPAGQPKKARRA